MIDYTKVKPRDKFRVIKELFSWQKKGMEVTVENGIDADGFFATDGEFYTWYTVEPITDKPALITRPIEGMPDWLANTPKPVAVKCRAKRVVGGPWSSYPVWIIGLRGDENPNRFCYVDDGYEYEYDIAEPWTEPGAAPEEKLYTKAEVLEAVEKALEERSER